MMRFMTMSQHKDLSLTISMISFGSYSMKSNLVVYFVSCSWPEVMNIHPCVLASNTISYRETLNPCKTNFDACPLQPTDGASGEYAGLLVIRQEIEDTRENRIHEEHDGPLAPAKFTFFLPFDETLCDPQCRDDYFRLLGHLGRQIENAGRDNEGAPWTTSLRPRVVGR